MFKVKLYIKDNGKNPVKEFLDMLPGKLSQKISWTIKVIETNERVSSEYLKKLSGTDGIWEIRIHFGNDAVRLLGFFEGNSLIIATNGFFKKTDKIPQKEIKIAEQRKKDYLWRKRN